MATKFLMCSLSCHLVFPLLLHFTKVVRPLVRYWHARGLRILVYLDDGLCAMSGEQVAMEASQLVQRTLEMAGFVRSPGI